jgi:hypothetical protein
MGIGGDQRLVEVAARRDAQAAVLEPGTATLLGPKALIVSGW